jgi:hypothetical protein
MLRTIALALVFTAMILVGIYWDHAKALYSPCPAVTEFCAQQDSLGLSFLCGIEELKQLISESTRIDCYRTWLELNRIENPTLNGWLDYFEGGKLQESESKAGD